MYTKIFRLLKDFWKSRIFKSQFIKNFKCKKKKKIWTIKCGKKIWKSNFEKKKKNWNIILKNIEKTMLKKNISKFH